MTTIFDSIMFCAAIYKTIEGLHRYIKQGDSSMLALIGAHSLVYFACVFPSNNNTVA